tara:strand:- start:6861 stop:7556 length:696 start_codon:yes stop_codon:yes gene_type:complete
MAEAQGFVSSGVVVGQTPRSGRDQKSDHLKGNKVTTGKNIPRQAEGAVGDITIRDVASVGLRCYIKADTGWVDINSLIATFRINWINMNLNTTSGWETDTSFGTPQYCKDQNGFVHFKGGADSAGSFSNTITTLPEGFRPPKTVYKLTTRTGLATTLQVVRITNLGVVNVNSQLRLNIDFNWEDLTSTANADATVGVNLEGISFFAKQKITSIGAGSTVSQDHYPSGYPVL